MVFDFETIFRLLRFFKRFLFSGSQFNTLVVVNRVQCKFAALNLAARDGHTDCVRLLINAGADKLRIGQTLWYNLTKNAVGGTLGSEKLAIQPGARTILDAPTTGNGDYPVKLFYRIPGDERIYPLCQTKWRHDPRSRGVAFIINENGQRSPRVMVFSDFRAPPPESP